MIAGFSASAAGHDGGFGHSRRTIAFFADEAGWSIEYRVRLSADEALLQLAQMDDDGDGRVSAQEKQRVLQQQMQRLARGLVIRSSAATAIPLHEDRVEVGPSFTQTFFYRLDSAVPELSFDDTNFAHKPGVVQVVAGPGVKAELRQPIDVHHAERVPLKVSRQAVKP